jgi:septum site-determining protein MinD
MGHKVLAVDCDIGLQNLDISLALSDTGAISFLDVCEGGYRLDQAAKHHRFETLSFLTAPLNRTAESIDDESFREMVRTARRNFDYIFLDAPAGIDAGFELAAKFADRCLIVTGADPAAIRDAARAAQRLELMGKRDVKLIVNRVSRKLFSTMSVTVDDVMDTAGLPLIGVVPEDQNVTLAAAFGTALIAYTNRGAAKACEAIAKRLEGRHVPLSFFDFF